jgi:elongation factor G
MDRENVTPEQAIQQVQDIFGARVVQVQLPIGQDSGFKGVVDLIANKAYLDGKVVEIPSDMVDAAEEARLELIEAAAEGEDELIEKYLEEGDLTDDEVLQGLRSGIRSGEFVPAFYGSATANIGIQALMDGIFALMPHPGEQVEEIHGSEDEEVVELAPTSDGPVVARVFKTLADPYVGKLSYVRVMSGVLKSDSRVHNHRADTEERTGQLAMARGKDQIAVEGISAGDIGAVTKLSETITGDTLGEKDNPVTLDRATFPYRPYSVAVMPKTKADSAKISGGLSRLCDEDPSLEWHQEPSTRQIILSGMGDVHIDVAVRRLDERLGVAVITETPKVPYHETISSIVSTQYRHKKQTGGAGQFAEVHLRVEPGERGAGYQFEWEVFGGRISQSFRPSIEKGIKAVMEQGVVAGYPVVDVMCAVFDGKEHPVDSKDIAFQIAGREVFKKAVLEARPVLLEPIMNVAVTVPEQYMGDVIGDLTSVRRGRVQDTTLDRGKATITGQVPLAEMQRYGQDLRSMTQGRGFYTIEMSHYDPMPSHVAEPVIEEARREKEEQSS